ncbi:hypothetical protein PMAYCL1PPCAC_10252 [Pristionchus mayeri]|uniref:Uncharacterized protein n=1 Tax=Pristionchus mayeri TaxID=1317129 RepID=A0AAN4ZF37_9BILA|nr:hypothetical protein PMAYCL1PPCAC_10252 [Pristionchus mayeri]
MIDCMRMRQCGLLEVVDTLNGHDLCAFDAGHIVINANASDKRDRTLRPRDELEADIANGVTDAPPYKENTADTYYPGRAAELQNFCLVNIMTRFRVAVVKKDGRRIGNDAGGGGDDGPIVRSVVACFFVVGGRRRRSRGNAENSELPLVGSLRTPLPRARPVQSDVRSRKGYQAQSRHHYVEEEKGTCSSRSSARAF